MEESVIGSAENPIGGSPLHVGLLIDGLTVSNYIYDFTRWAQSEPNVIVTALILQTESEDRSVHKDSFLFRLINSLKNRELTSALGRAIFPLLTKFEQMLIKKDERYREHSFEYDLSAFVVSKIFVSPNISVLKSGKVYKFNETDIERVKALKLDVLLRWESGGLQGEILKAARLGVISVDLGDIRSNRSGPPGFWEVYCREKVTGFAVERATDDMHRDILAEGKIPTRHYYILNQAFVSRKANFYLKKVVQEIAHTSQLPERLSSFPYSRRVFKNPNAVELAAYFVRYSYAVLIKKIRAVLNIHYRWSVAYVFQNWQSADLSRGITLKNRPYHYLADPFVIERHGKNYCFVEDLDHRQQRGVIDVYELMTSRGVRLGTALEEDFHLSFPYLFEYQNELFMCPESAANKEIRIYKCVDFPLQWKLEKIIMNHVSAADTMIFQMNDKWWMLTNVDVADVGDYRSELCIFSADSPLDENWKPHPLNPVIVDASRARNAGCFFEQDNYFRFSQSQGFDLYGERILVNKIVELNDSKYIESCTAVIEPVFLPDIIGTHHMHSNGRVTVFDFATRTRMDNEGH